MRARERARERGFLVDGEGESEEHFEGLRLLPSFLPWKLFRPF